MKRIIEAYTALCFQELCPGVQARNLGGLFVWTKSQTARQVRIVVQETRESLLKAFDGYNLVVPGRRRSVGKDNLGGHKREYQGPRLNGDSRAATSFLQHMSCSSLDLI